MPCISCWVLRECTKSVKNICFKCSKNFRKTPLWFSVCSFLLHCIVNEPLSNQMFASFPPTDPYLVSTPKQWNFVYLCDTNLLSSNIQATNRCHIFQERLINWFLLHFSESNHASDHLLDYFLCGEEICTDGCPCPCVNFVLIFSF